MTFPLLPLIQSGSQKLEISKVEVVGRILLPFASIKASKFFSHQFPAEVEVYVDASKSKISVEDVVELLNVGVYQIIIDESLVDEIISGSGLPSSRFAIKVKSEVPQVAVKTNSALVFTKQIDDDSIKKYSDDGNRQLFCYIENVGQDKAVKMASQGLVPIIASEQLTDQVDASGDLVSISKLLTATLTTDRQDNLFTTLVVGPGPAYSALGVVYSSRASIEASIASKEGVYQSRKRPHELWYKGKTSGATQKLLKIEKDCDSDVVKFIVDQKEGTGFCHLSKHYTCFQDGELKESDDVPGKGLAKLNATLQKRFKSAPSGSYTKRLFEDELLLVAKLKEELDELIEAGKNSTKDRREVAWECADLFYFALVWCIKHGASLQDIEKNLDVKSKKVTRRKGDAKEAYLEKKETKLQEEGYRMQTIVADDSTVEQIEAALNRPVQKTADIMKLVLPIIEKVKKDGDAALLELTSKFDGVNLDTPVLNAPFPEDYMNITDEMKKAIDLSMANIEKFHAAQLPKEEVMTVETSPGVFCSRFAKPIENVGLYVPGGTAVLPSTAMMLGVPAKVAGCSNIVVASPPSRSTGRLTPEVVYVAHKLGAKCIVMAGGAQAVTAMAYGTQSVLKCDKILGPGNQFVTAAKMHVQNDTLALCSIDMPAGPSEVLVIADENADADFVASDLLSQAEHGIDSQVILIGVNLNEHKVVEIEQAIKRQAEVLPRKEIVSKCLAHSSTLLVNSYKKAFDLSNKYAPEHLILQIDNASSFVPDYIVNAGSVFVGGLSPESCGDYSSGTNHTLPTYGYARQYSGVNTATFQKFITSQNVTKQGLKSIGQAVMMLAEVEGLEAHRNAIDIRMRKLGLI